MKTCYICKREKSLIEFCKSVSSSDGRHSYCRACSSEYSSKRRTAAALEKMKNDRLQRLYGISVEEYYEILEIQNGVCAICGVSPSDKRLAVDHCHTLNIIRGLLCDRCNTTLGKCNDDVLLLRKMIDYLELTSYMISDNDSGARQRAHRSS